jgi:hypothetical protein
LLVAGEVRDERDLDDWFAEPKPLPDQWSLSRPEPGEEAAPAEKGELADWLHELPHIAQRSPRQLGGVGARRLALAAAFLGLCLLIGLVAAGVFSGHSPRASAPTAGATPLSGLTASSTPAAFTPPALSPPATTLKLGARGPRVIALQRALTRLGYYKGRIDGQYGPGTESALSRFQTVSGLSPDGILGPLTRRALKSALER